MCRNTYFENVVRMAKIGKEINRGSEFRVFEFQDNEVLKIPRFPYLMYFVFGSFKKKNEHDLQFLQKYYAEFLPSTKIVAFKKSWAIRQRRIKGKPFFSNPEMTFDVRTLFDRSRKVFQETGKIPDLSNPGNLIREDKTGRLFLVDTSILGGRRWWPIGFLVTRFLGRILFDSIKNWLRSGF